jgi:F-type H+-transporting ATPase subunit epsilon
MADHTPASTIYSALHCVVVTPEQTVVETTADFVALPIIDGEYGVGPGHSPLIGRLGYGELRIRNGKEVRRYYADGGFVQVNRNVDSAAAAEQLRTANARKAAGAEELAIRERLIAQARGQLRVASR